MKKHFFNKYFLASLGILTGLAIISSIASVAYATSPVTVSTYDELLAIMDSLYENDTADQLTIVFNNDIVQTPPYNYPVINFGDEITLDLAGHTLTLDSEQTYAIDNSGTLNITGNGIITNYATTDGSALIANSGNLNLISGQVISHSTSAKYDYRAAIDTFGGTFHVSDGFIIKADADQSVGVMIHGDSVYGGDSKAIFGDTIGSTANQLEISGAADGVVVINGEAIFNNGKYFGGTHGIVVVNYHSYNSDDEMYPVDVTIKYAEIDSDGEYDFYAGIDSRYCGSYEGESWSVFYPDKRNVNIELRNGILGKGLITNQDSTKDWNANINKSAFSVKVTNISDNTRTYEIQNKTDNVSVAEDGVIKGQYSYYEFVENPDNPWLSVWDALDATDEYEYSDQYFASPSPGIHSKLRTMSYALALASFENQADGYPYDDDEAPNPKLRKLLSELGFSDYQSWDESSKPDGNSMGTSIAHKTITYQTTSGEVSQELIVVAPRNYNYMAEWLSNFNVGQSGDHAGFTDSADLIIERLNQYISDHHLSDYKIWIVGYSRGGAVVDLVAKQINETLSDYSMSADDLYAYTFGAPRASTTETKYSNIHDVKDGDDLLLGYIFPTAWGFYNTGVYEEIHAPELEISAIAIDITKLANSSEVVSLLANNDGTVADLGAVNAKAFVDEWLEFIVSHGLTREYFDTTVKPPLSKLMQAYQNRTVDKQSEFTNFLGSTDIYEPSLLVMVAFNAMGDLNNYPGDTIEEKLDNFPTYQDIVKILRGTATTADCAELATYLRNYIGDYNTSYPVTEEEFLTIKEALPDLIEAIGPLLTADAKYTIENKGENYSLYYISTIVSNFNQLVAGHIPEVIMPILKASVDSEEDSEEFSEEKPAEEDQVKEEQTEENQTEKDVELQEPEDKETINDANIEDDPAAHPTESNDQEEPEPIDESDDPKTEDAPVESEYQNDAITPKAPNTGSSISGVEGAIAISALGVLGSTAILAILTKKLLKRR